MKVNYLNQIKKIQTITALVDEENGIIAVKAEDKKELPNTGSVNAGETSVGSRVAKDANKLPSTGDESSILTTVGMAIMSLFGILYIGKHRKNTNKEV